MNYENPKTTTIWDLIHDPDTRNLPNAIKTLEKRIESQKIMKSNLETKLKVSTRKQEIYSTKRRLETIKKKIEGNMEKVKELKDKKKSTFKKIDIAINGLDPMERVR